MKTITKMNKTNKKEISGEEKSLTNIVPAKNEAVKQPFTQAQIELITRTVAKGATTDELKLFLIVANKTGLDPFSKQIHFVKRKQKQKDGSYIEVGAIQTGIDGYRAIAERSGGYAGSDDAVYDTEEGKPNKCTVTVYRIVQGIRVPFTATARWKEYCPPSPLDFMWNKMPFLMLGKTAEALALRKAFPNDLSGIHVDEEMDRVGQVITAPEEVTVQPKLPEKKEEKIQASSTESLFNLAREFGAKAGEESLFIQENLGINIEWDLVDTKAAANLKTQLMAKCVKK